jgi:NADH:ubiquinone reductase (H+-translocating)
VGSRKPLLTFVVAGGGFAGVETIGAINDFVREALRFYPSLGAGDMRMVLVTPDEMILPELGPKLGVYAQRKLISRGIEVLTKARVAELQDGTVKLTDGRAIPTCTLVWTAGNAGNPLVAALPIPNRGGRVMVNKYREVEGAPGVWALGDCALVPDLHGGFHPPTAQHALRQGRVLGDNIAAAIAGAKKEALSFLDPGTTCRDRPPHRRGQHPGPEVLRLHRLVAVANDLFEQAAAAGEEDPRRPSVMSRK